MPVTLRTRLSPPPCPMLVDTRVAKGVEKWPVAESVTEVATASGSNRFSGHISFTA